MPQCVSEVICLGEYKSKMVVFSKLANLKGSYFHILPYYYIFFFVWKTLLRESGKNICNMYSFILLFF